MVESRLPFHSVAMSRIALRQMSDTNLSRGRGAVGVCALAIVLLTLAGCGGGDSAADDADSAPVIYRDAFQPAFADWKLAREREAERLETVREDWNAEPRNLLLMAEHDRLLALATAEREAAEAVVQVHAARLIRDYYWTYEANCVQRDFLSVLRDEIRLLLQRRASLREQYARPLHPAEHDLVQAESVQLEGQIAVRFTSMQRHFGSSQMIRQLEEEVLRPRYEELIKALAGLDADPTVATASLDERTALLLASLADLKRRYPLAEYTRKAEKHIVPITAPRSLLDLRGWPAAVFFCCLALLLVGFGRALAAYIAKRQKDDEAAAARVFRPAPWVRGTQDPATSGGAPGATSSDSMPTVPLAPRRPAPALPRDEVTPPPMPPAPPTTDSL